jgi:hypothetical protein
MQGSCALGKRILWWNSTDNFRFQHVRVVTRPTGKLFAHQPGYIEATLFMLSDALTS